MKGLPMILAFAPFDAGLCPCFSIRPSDVKRQLCITRPLVQTSIPLFSRGHSSVPAYARIELTRGAAVKNGRFLSGRRRLVLEGCEHGSILPAAGTA
jgi:hypothetical protein